MPAMTEAELIEEIFSIVQTFLKKPPLIIWGSGATISLGMPSMSTLNQVLKQKINIFDDTNDNLEIELGKEKYLDVIPEIKKVIWDTINSADKNVLNKIIEKTNTDIQGIKSLLNKFLDAHPLLVNIITTNYDRVLENVMTYNNITFTDGFNGKNLSIFDETLFKKEKNVNLVKVHGSLNWFSLDGEIRYLQQNYDESYPQIIAPGKNKYQEAHKSPYRELIHKADDLIRNASSFLVIGFGFNDEHLTPLITKMIKQGIPIVLIAKQITENSLKELENAEKFIFIEDSNNEKSKVQYKVNSSSEMKEVTINGSYWQLKKFMEII